MSQDKNKQHKRHMLEKSMIYASTEKLPIEDFILCLEKAQNINMHRQSFISIFFFAQVDLR